MTTDHDEIRQWVESRGGHPACVKGTERSNSCLLRIDYPGFAGQGKLQEISWDEFFESFDQNKLAFLYQDKTKAGRQSRFSKLVDGAKAGGSKSGGRSGGRSHGKSAR